MNIWPWLMRLPTETLTAEHNGIVPFGDAAIVLTLPKEFGFITRIYEIRGRMIADTQSGVTVLLPINKERPHV